MKIIMSAKLRQTIQAYVDNCDIEISGLGSVEYRPQLNAFEVTKLFLPKQTCSGTTTEMLSDSILDISTQHPHDSICFWWHSHVNMGCFWSGEDRKTLDKMTNDGLCVASVFNKRGESRSFIGYQSTPVFGTTQVKTELDDVKLVIQDNVLTGEELANIKDAIQNQVTRETFAPNYRGWDNLRLTYHHPLYNPSKTGNTLGWDNKPNRNRLWRLYKHLFTSKREFHDLAEDARQANFDLEDELKDMAQSKNIQPIKSDLVSFTAEQDFYSRWSDV